MIVRKKMFKAIDKTTNEVVFDKFDINTHLELSIESDELIRILKMVKRTYDTNI